VGRNSSVGIGNRSGWTIREQITVQAKFSESVQIGPGAHPASYSKYTGSVPGVKRPWRDNDHSPTSSAEVKDRVQLYLHSPSGPSRPAVGRTLTFTFNHPQYKSHSFCYAVKFSVLSLSFQQAALLGNCDRSCKIFPTNVISDERNIMSVFSYEAHESRMQRTSLPHLVNSVENPDHC
jgi:hypothetical protein